MFKTKNYSLAIKPFALCVAIFTSLALSGCGGGGDSSGSNTGAQTPATKSVTIISGKA